VGLLAAIARVEPGPPLLASLGFSRFGIFIIVAHLSASLASALKRAVKPAKTHALTALMNSCGFDEEACRLRELARRHGRSTTMVFIDVDDFKQINDRFDHNEGAGSLNLLLWRSGQAFKTPSLLADIAATSSCC
jgi:predicted signal transduction protein with EAL and GGDEF domain